MVSRRPGESAPTGASPGCRSRHDRQRLAGRPRSLPGGGHERPCGEADRQGAPGALSARSSRQERRQGAPATTADAGRTGRGAGRYRRAFRQPGAIVQVLRRFVPDMQDLFAQLERQLGEGDVQGSAATLHTIKGSASTVGASALADRASELEQALRRADPLRGMEILAGIRLDELRTLVRCLPAPPAGDVRRRAGGVGELNPGAVASPAKDSGGPGARLHPLRPVGRITPWALSADTPEARPGLERHPLPVVQCLQASRSRSWALSRA